MKLTKINFPKFQNKSVTFSGYSNRKTAAGEDVLEFFAPPYDKNKYQIELEVASAKRDGFSNLYSSERNTETLFTPESDGKFRITKDEVDLINCEGEHLAYRFKLTDKNSKEVKYVTEPGLKDFKKNFNIIPKNTSAPQKHGTMYHMFVDSYHNPSWSTQKPNTTRNHFNIFGGNIQGIIEKIKEGKLDSYGLLMTTPLFGKDEISSHGYWTANPYQIASTKGNVEDFKNLNFELFKKGKQYIADGAFTSQGYQSPLFQNVLQWGKQSPFFAWFNLDEIKENLSDTTKINLPALPAQDEAMENTTYKIIEKDDQILLQLYDKRFVTAEDANSNKIIKKYDLEKHKETKDINTYKDSTNLYYFDITGERPETIKKLKAGAGKPIENASIQLMNFSIVQPREASGANFWDGNLDLIKMNLAKGTLASEQARHYLYKVATYWTKTIANALAIKTAQETKTANDIKQIAHNNRISDSSFEEIKTNIENDNYAFASINNGLNDNDFLLNEILEFPLESIELPDNLVAILSDSAISPNLKSVDEKYKSNIELMENTQIQAFYKDNILKATKDILNALQKERKDIFEGDKLTNLGKIIARNLIPEVVKYTVINKLGGADCIDTAKGVIEYKQENISRLSTSKFVKQGYNYDSIKDEVVKSLLSNKGNINSDTVGLFVNKYKNIDGTNLKLATAIIEQSGAGLNWRFDAAKDVSSFELTKKVYEENVGRRNFETTMDSFVDFWQEFTKKIKEQNPNSYIIAEVTDIGKYYNWDHDAEGPNGVEFNKKDFGKYRNPSEAEKIFYEKTGITTGSNYTQYFGLYPQLFGRNIENGEMLTGEKAINLDTLRAKNKEFTNLMPLSFIVNNHVFTDNHDKPRTLHGFALDMNAFLNGNENTKISSKGSGVAQFYYKTIDSIDNSVISAEEKEKLKTAVSYLELGKTSKDSPENRERARTFGTRPIEVTVNEIFDMANISSKAKRTAYTKAILETGLKTPMSKYLALWQIMVGNVGTPAIFGGTEYGQTGHETPSKNQELACRNIIMHERANSKDAFNNFYKQINAISGLSNEKGLSAISGGVPVSFDAIPSGCGAQNVTGVYKYDETGSEVLNILYLGNSVKKEEYGKALPMATFNPFENSFADAIWLKNYGEQTPAIENEIFVEGTRYKRKEYSAHEGKYIDSADEFIIRNGQLVSANGQKIRLDVGNNIFYKV